MKNTNTNGAQPEKISEFEYAINRGQTEGINGKPAEYWDMWRKAIDEGRAKKIKQRSVNGRKFDAWEMDNPEYKSPEQPVRDWKNDFRAEYRRNHSERHIPDPNFEANKLINWFETHVLNPEQPAPASPELTGEGNLISLLEKIIIAYGNWEDVQFVIDEKQANVRTWVTAHPQGRELFSKLLNKPTEQQPQEEGMIAKHLRQIKTLGVYYSIVSLLQSQRELCLENLMKDEFYRKNKNDFPKSRILHAPTPKDLEQWKVDPPLRAQSIKEVLQRFFIFVPMAAREKPKVVLPAEMEDKIIAAIEDYRSQHSPAPQKEELEQEPSTKTFEHLKSQFEYNKWAERPLSEQKSAVEVWDEFYTEWLALMSMEENTWEWNKKILDENFCITRKEAYASSKHKVQDVKSAVDLLHKRGLAWKNEAGWFVEARIEHVIEVMNEYASSKQPSPVVEQENMSDFLNSKNEDGYGLYEADMLNDIKLFKERIAQLKSALGQLVMLKNLKEAHGKTAEYLQLQPQAWEAAQRVMQFEQAVQECDAPTDVQSGEAGKQNPHPKQLYRFVKGLPKNEGWYNGRMDEQPCAIDINNGDAILTFPNGKIENYPFINRCEWLEPITPPSPSLSEQLRATNPYPENVFPLIGDNQLREITKIMVQHKVSLDRFFAQWGREVWGKACDELAKLLSNNNQK